MSWADHEVWFSGPEFWIGEKAIRRLVNAAFAGDVDLFVTELCYARWLLSRGPGDRAHRGIRKDAMFSAVERVFVNGCPEKPLEGVTSGEIHDRYWRYRRPKSLADVRWAVTRVAYVTNWPTW